MSWNSVLANLIRKSIDCFGEAAFVLHSSDGRHGKAADEEMKAIYAFRVELFSDITAWAPPLLEYLLHRSITKMALAQE